ncbi:MAG: hypothetical protein ABMA26_06460 [Limisphaerales bacterium]
MTVGPTKLIALGVGLLLVAGIAAIVLAKRHERRLSVAGALAVAALQTQVSNATGLSAGTARGIRIPFYEGDAKQPTSVMLGRTATPVEGGRYLVSDLRVEHYTRSHGSTATNLVIEAPKCLVDPAKKIASSDGIFVMTLTHPDGSLLTRGSTGFEWRQADSFLSISNEVATHMTIERSISTNPAKP